MKYAIRGSWARKHEIGGFGAAGTWFHETREYGVFGVLGLQYAIGPGSPISGPEASRLEEDVPNTTADKAIFRGT